MMTRPMMKRQMFFLDMTRSVSATLIRCSRAWKILKWKRCGNACHRAHGRNVFLADDAGLLDLD
jgi:hypothetical protein